ncbi:MAG: pyridoxamine kinase [Roseburia sp.]|nr:pyridoxamine kinase [Roseburia sp.]
MKTKRILTMQDLSCAGQCSLTVALPILSRYGVETCVLPTAVLSNHTMFKSWSYLDLTPELPAIFENWKSNGIKFDAFLLGYLGKKELMALAEECFDGFANGGAPIIIDPVFADNGKLYGGFDLAYVAEMKKLIRRADIILPNVTEACFLTGTEYREEHSDEYIKELANKLFDITGKTVVITGVEWQNLIGEYILTEIMRDKKPALRGDYVMLEKLPEKRHGTGDIFASVFTANYLNGKSLSECCSAASRFVIDCLKATDPAHFYGVNFERVLNS